MVYQPTQPSEIKKKHERSKIVQILLDVLTLVLVAGATYAIFRLTTVKPENQETNNPDVVTKVPVDQEEEDKAWLTRTIGAWLETFSRDFQTGVEVYDLDNDLAIGEAFADERFSGHIESEIGAKFGVCQTVPGAISAREMVEVIKAAFKHEGMSDEEWQGYKATLLEQPEVYSEERCLGYCKVRAGLPAGFSEKVKVYNENFMDTNGSFFEVYRDVALVEFTTAENKTRSFAVVVLGRGFSFQTDFQNLGQMLEKRINIHLDNE